tara:strand:+ start:14 stop:1144 length:1131 start_codon:yes stop_codon:yes gene_type:complete
MNYRIKDPEQLEELERSNYLPKPCLDIEFMESVMEQGFNCFPERKENYVKFKSSKRSELLNYLPVKLDIENVSRCNFRCTMCQVSDWTDNKRADDMSFNDFKNLIDSQYGLVEIKLQGMGEPFLGKSYFRMIEYARARHLWVRSTTNGALLNINDNYKRVIDADICEIQVSIDAATATTYEKIRKGGRFNKILKDCRLLNRYAKDSKRNRTRMWAVAQQNNFRELNKLPDLAADLGFDRLSITLDLNDWGQEKWRNKNDKEDVQSKIDRAMAEHIVSLGKKKDVEVTFWYIDKKFSMDSPEELCPWPFERAYISSDMRIVPCCMISNPDIYELGDARSLTKEWNNKKMLLFRRMHLSGNIPDVCKSCYYKNNRGLI